MGGITEIATSAPGYSSVRPKDKAPLAETLKLNGYSTAQFGKCHEVPVWQTSPMGPFDAWPTGGGGFEHFYGFIGAETNQWAPAIYRDTVPVEPDRTPEEGYHFTEDMTDRAIEWIGQQKSLMPDKPFFVYFAPGATHAPHHVPKEWADRYAGRFDAGWDALREQTVQRQRQLGVIPADAELTARPAEVPAWDDMPDDLKPVLARQMEIYAGFLEHTDHHIGRLIDSLAELEVLDDTLVYVIIGDNGASGEGTLNGTFSEGIPLNGASAHGDGRVHDQPDRRLRRTEGQQPLRRRLGARHGHPVPVDQAGRLTLGRHPQRADRALAVRYRGEGRDADPIRPRHRRRADRPGGGAACRTRPSCTASSRHRSRASACCTPSTTPSAAERHETQYFEIFVNRGIYHQGWTAVTRHSTPWGAHDGMPALDDDVWELYAPDDWTQAHNVAAEQPEQLRDLQRLFLLEAGKYNVFPLDDRRYERFNSDLAGRPQLVKGNTQMLFGGMGRLSENSVINIKNKSHAVTADLSVPASGAAGVIIAQGGRFGGWSLYVHDGKPAYCYNLLGVQQFKVHGDTDLSPATIRCGWSSPTTAADSARAARSASTSTANPSAQGRVDATQPMIFSADETTDLGADSATPVSDDYGTQNSTLHRSGPLGADRPRRGRRGRRPLHHSRGALPGRRRHPVNPGHGSRRSETRGVPWYCGWSGPVERLGGSDGSSSGRRGVTRPW